MEKKVLAFLFAGFLLLQFASAIDTEIKIMAPSNSDVRLEFINPDAISIPGETSLIKLERLNSGDSGEISYTFTTIKETFNLHYTLSNNGTKLVDGVEKEIVFGEHLKLILIEGIEEVIRDYAEPEVEVTTEIISSESEKTAVETTEEVVDSEEEVVSEETESSSKFNALKFLSILKFSGFATSEDEGSSGFFYGGAVVFVFVVFVMFLVYKRKKKMKISSNSSSVETTDTSYGKDFLDRRIDEARDE